MSQLRISFILAAFYFLFSSCDKTVREGSQMPLSDSHQEMVKLLATTKQKRYNANNTFCAEAKLAQLDSALVQAATGTNLTLLLTLKFRRAQVLLEMGQEAQSVAQFEELLPYHSQLDPQIQYHLLAQAAIAYLRLGERTNCLNNHSADACIFPVQGRGIHTDQSGSRKAVELYQAALNLFPKDNDARWLLNIAYMTLGEYPGSVPTNFLIPGLEKPSETDLLPFEDMAGMMGLALDNRAGGVVVEDFDNDGYLDIVTSAWGVDDPMHYFHNNGDGTFSDRSEASGLSTLTGGLNMVDADYDNDGFIDIYVLRGGWQGITGDGDQPNSLIKNNGDGTFTDVTTKAGVLSFMPTQTATWNDFNRDGWVDLFVGNETTSPTKPRPCELYINNQDGTFTNAAKEVGVEINKFVKGVASGDFDNDGWPDIFISTQDSTTKVLLRNKGISGKMPAFEDVAQKAGVLTTGQTFGTWFWDYDNDGWLDIFMADYDFEKPLSFYAGREAMKPTNIMEGKMYLYRNNQNGTFSDVTHQTNLNKLAFAMGNNFGDLDHDGWLDFYLATGNPSFQSLVPNKLFKNMGGKKFADVTTASRMGHLQKGHAIAFADLDNDGDQDVFAEMGGAYRGDHFPNSFYLNPGQEKNNWIYLELEGTTSNKAAIGARIEVRFNEAGKQRSVFRDVNTGGSFGCSPLRREIGVGKAAMIDEITVRWPATGKTQSLKNIRPNQFLLIKEGQEGFATLNPQALDFKARGVKGPMCKPDERLTGTN